MTTPSWWEHIYGRPGPDESDQRAALGEVHAAAERYDDSVFTEDGAPQLWAELLDAAITTISEDGPFTPATERLHDAVLALTVQLRPLPPDPMVVLAQRHRGWSDKADDHASRWD